MSDVTIRHDIRSGDLGRIISLHGIAYEPLGGFGLKFEAYVAKTIAEFFLENRANGRIWFAEQGERLLGCAAIAKRGNGVGQLRWVLVDQSARGLGLGRRLVQAALDYCVAASLTRVYLETTTGLAEAMSLYDKLGFKVLSEEIVDLWDGSGALITMELHLAATSA